MDENSQATAGGVSERLQRFLDSRSARPAGTPGRKPWDQRELGISEVGIQRVSYTHKAMVDLMLSNPQLSQGQIAKHFGYTEAWFSQILASDAFQSYYAERREEILDPTLVATLEENFKSLVLLSAQKLRRKMEGDQLDADQLTNLIGVASKALGYGAKAGIAVQVNTQYVVQVPSKLASSSEWESQIAQGQGRVIEGTPGTPVLGSPSGTSNSEKEAA